MRIAAAAMLSLALLAPAAGAAPAHRAAGGAPARDWSATVTRAPSGGYVLGNPRARLRLVEYASLTCSHCAAFSAEGWPALRANYLRRGLVSLEMRHAVRDRADLAASLLARCAGPRGYFATLERLFAAQADWLPKAAAAPEGDPADTPAAREAALVATADAADLPAIARAAPAAAAACLRNPAEQKALGAMTDEAWGVRHIAGTPTFLINDKMADGSSWKLLEPQIAAALR
ncbi:DsbA family protein [Sphingomonas profundi]|uniref:DsbA family protein n=1 Tax=Alterirhizorhabdus profundi TaxID=2681549 RepID=UPI0012E7EFF3|nr:thioredoxin domain-containing protein [Sphingomonas profundi]